MPFRVARGSSELARAFADFDVFLFHIALNRPNQRNQGLVLLPGPKLSDGGLMWLGSWIFVSN